MPDRIEREIEEILAKLDMDEQPRRNERAPISILSQRGKTKSQPAAPRQEVPRRSASPNIFSRVTPATLLLTGAGMVIGGLLFAGAWDPLIWVSFAGVVLFLSAFAWSFVRTPRPDAGPARGHFWRDRYIEYNANPGPWDRIRRRFRR